VKVLCVFGTRPEAIKMAPVVMELQRRSKQIETVICITAQHREMLDQVLNLFNIQPDIDLNLMEENQSLPELTSRVLLTMNEVLQQVKPHWVLIQGDTTTVLATALAAFYLKIPIGHVEAGLRTQDRYNPFPEEINRRLVGALATFHFAPTERAKKALLKEGISADMIFVTGNTIVDALYWILKQPLSPLSKQLFQKLGLQGATDKKLILVTAHRRESFGSPMESLCRGLRKLVERNKDVVLVYPVHKNPNVRKTVWKILDGHERILLLEPLPYGPFIRLMEKSYLILTDSGGIQEEAPVLGKPVLVLRKRTERPEVIEAGVGKLVGTDEDRIVQEVEHLLRNEEAYRSMARKGSIFGDGRAAERIVNILMTKGISNA